MDQQDVVTTIPATPTLATGKRLLRFARSYPGRRDQVREVRSFLRVVTTRCPRANDVVAVGSELAANACIHSRSRLSGGTFTVRVQISTGDYLYVEVSDGGGSWLTHACDVIPEHGLDLVQAIAGPTGWGVRGDDSGRVVWARLCWPGTEHRAAYSIKSGTECGWDDDEIAELGELAEQLAVALTARAVGADIEVRADRLPYLAVYVLDMPERAQRIYPQADWWLWANGERIVASADIEIAADLIARQLEGWIRQGDG